MADFEGGKFHKHKSNPDFLASVVELSSQWRKKTIKHFFGRIRQQSCTSLIASQRKSLQKAAKASDKQSEAIKRMDKFIDVESFASRTAAPFCS